MSKVLLKRVLLGVLTLFVVSLAVFAATQALPGDPARAILGRDATPARLAALREQLHVQGSWPSQYLHWLGGVLRLDLGQSMAAKEPVTHVLWPALGNSTVLLLCAAVIATPLSLAIGTWSALRKDRAADHVVSIVTLVLAALPEFTVGIFLVVLFATGAFHLLPAVYVSLPGQHVWSEPRELVLPTLTLVLAVSPYIIRMMRATMLEVLDSPYVLQARLKGVPERTVILRHALPNAIGPVAQVIALQLAWLLGGVVVIEFLFRYPGVGFALVDGVHNQDLPLIQAIVLAIALFYVLVNLFADVITLVANPKVRTAR